MEVPWKNSPREASLPGFGRWRAIRDGPDRCVNLVGEEWAGEQGEDQASPPWFKQKKKEGRGEGG